MKNAKNKIVFIVLATLCFFSFHMKKSISQRYLPECDGFPPSASQCSSGINIECCIYWDGINLLIYRKKHI